MDLDLRKAEPREPEHTSQLPPRRPRNSAVALTALVALVVAAFATGGYLYRQSSRPAKTTATDQGRTSGTAGDSTAVPTPAAEPKRAAEPAPPADQRPARSQAPADFTGGWTISTRVDESSRAEFRGLRLTYHVDLRQDGDRITGSGRKVAENGRSLPSAGQTPISVSGTIVGDQLRLTFTERGARRQSSGTLNLTHSGGALRGSFSSNAARSSGSADAQRR